MDRRTIALGVVAALAVVAAVAVTVANRTHTSAKRTAVASYITQVNVVQEELRAPLARVLKAYRDFGRGNAANGGSARGLSGAVRTLTTVRRRTAALDAPPQAHRLRRLILALMDEQIAVSREVQQLAAFTPRYRAALAELQRAGQVLSASLTAITPPKSHRLTGTRKQILQAQATYAAAAVRAEEAQALAVDDYDGSLLLVLRHLRRLRPPRALTPAFAAQVRSITTIRATGARLSAALRSGDRSVVPSAGAAFTSASRISQSLTAQKAEIAAIKAYNRRARAVSAAAGRVQREVAHLQQTVA